MTKIEERRPGTQPGSIHSPVACMNDIIACARQTGNTVQLEHMLEQLRTAWATANNYERGGLLWLGRRYRAALDEIKARSQTCIRY